MAREEKRIELRPVDDPTVLRAPVVRLETEETRQREKPVRLGTPAAEAKVSRRLDLPDRDEVEMRTYQPGIEALIEIEAANPDLFERDWGKASTEHRQIPWGWFALIGLMLAGAILWSLTQLGGSSSQVRQARVETTSALKDDARQDLEAEQLVGRIEATIFSFFRSSDVNALIPLVRHSSRVRPLMEIYHASNPIIGHSAVEISRLEPLTLDRSGDFWLATVNLDGKEKRNMVVDVSDPAHPLIDWETLVCHQPMPWDTFAKERPTQTSLDFRVYVELDNFHSHEFADSTQWNCFRLTALGGEETVFGYARANESVASRINELLNQNRGGVCSMILRLHIPEGLQSRSGVIIEKVINPRWLYVEPPDSGS